MTPESYEQFLVDLVFCWIGGFKQKGSFHMTPESYDFFLVDLVFFGVSGFNQKGSFPHDT